MIVPNAVTLESPAGCTRERKQRSRRRLVVLSQDRRFLRLLRMLFGELGLEVITHVEAFGPVRLISRLQPDLVILDIALTHERCGWAILQGLGEDPSTARIPVIVCSPATWILAERPDLLERDGVFTWAEPFEATELIRIVANRLSETQGAARQDTWHLHWQISPTLPPRTGKRGGLTRPTAQLSQVTTGANVDGYARDKHGVRVRRGERRLNRTAAPRPKTSV
jgi:DNA-binding response OmpR family regulator